MLNTHAELRNPRCRIFLVNPDDSGGNDWNGDSAVAPGSVRVGEQNVACPQGVPKRGIGSTVVHVVALNAFVHDAIATANYGFATAGQVVGKPETRPEVRPGIIGKSFGNSVLASDTYPVEVELVTLQRGDGACAQARASRSNLRICRIGPDRRICRVVKVGVEV